MLTRTNRSSAPRAFATTILLSAVGLTLAACANRLQPTASPLGTGAPSGDGATGFASPVPVLSSTRSGDNGPTIDWDNPIVDGVPATTGTAAKVGGLAMDVRQPRFAVQPFRVQVSDPAKSAPGQRAVAFVFHFPIGADFPVDGRVRVLEQATISTTKDLQDVAANPPGNPQDFSMITIAGNPALLVQANGIGRVQFIRSGVLYDVTGPAVSPTEAILLANLL